MTNDNESDEEEEDQGRTTRAECTEGFATSTDATISLSPDFEAWVQRLKDDAENALQLWEDGNDIGTEQSQNVVTFFIFLRSSIFS